MSLFRSRPASSGIPNTGKEIPNALHSLFGPRSPRRTHAGLVLLAAVLVVGAGIALGLWRGHVPRTGVTRAQVTTDKSRRPRSPVGPDWGGGSLSFRAGSEAEILDSVRVAAGEDSLKTRVYAGPAGGAALREKSGGDHALALAMPSSAQPGQSGVFELPSTEHFREQLLPGARDAKAPAADIPIYPKSNCRMQVGRGTACFIGFYLTPDDVEAVRSFYVRALSRLGWQRVTSDRQGFLEAFTKNSEDRTVAVQFRRQDSLMTRIGLVATTPGHHDRSERK